MEKLLMECYESQKHKSFWHRLLCYTYPKTFWNTYFLLIYIMYSAPVRKIAQQLYINYMSL